MFFRLLLWIALTVSVNANAIDHLCQAIPSGGVLTVNFSQQKTLLGLPKPITSTGELVLCNGHGLLWITKTPFANTLLLGKKGIFRLENGEKQSVMKGQPQDHMILSLLTKVLTGEFSSITEFTMTRVSNSKNNWKIRLTPVGGIAKVISSIDVSGDKLITHISIHRTNGDRDDISLQNHKVIATLPKSMSDLFHD